MDYFQDDLFPPTREIWKETLTSTEWFEMKDKEPMRLQLCPDGKKKYYQHY